MRLALRGIFIALCLLSVPALAESRLINGKPVEPGTWKEVIQISSNGSKCTAAIIGPRAVATAAHCAAQGATATFTVGSTTYTMKMFRSPLYSTKDHDVAIGVTTQDIVGVEPASVGGKAVTGLGITLLGYGCTNPGGGGGNDGVLRIGDTTVTGFSGFDMVSRKAGGAALCFGDSGGPAMLVENGKHLLIGINSKGNIQDTNYNTRTDLPESSDFYKTLAQEQGIQICGVNKDCGTTPPLPTKPTCTLSANPASVKIGQSLSLNLITQGQVTGATIEGNAVGFPTASLSITPNAVGSFTASATVTGPGGSNTCSAGYTVQNDTPPLPTKPTCTLSANPQTVKLGQQVSLEMQTQGNVTSASIEGTSVPFPFGKKIVTPSQQGNFTASALVSGPGGSNTCSASYEVEGNDPVDPTTPNFAVVAAFCGDNVIAETPISKVCLGVVKKDSGMTDMRFSQVLLVTYRDTTKEVMPVILKKTQPQASGDTQVREELTLYANASVSADKYMVLDTRSASVTKLPQGSGDVPTAIQGRTAKGYYYVVDQLHAFNVGN